MDVLGTVSPGGILVEMLRGLGVTLILTFLSFACALVLGTMLAAMRISPIIPLRAIGTVYVEVVRNIPPLAIIVIFVYGFPYVGIEISLFASAVVCISAYEASYICEAIRFGVNSVPRGQAEAARSLGLTSIQTMRSVVLAQAMRTAVQPLGNIFISLSHNTSLASAIGVLELTQTASLANLQLEEPIPLFFGAGLGYMLVSVGAGQIIGIIERRVRIHR